MMVVRKKINCGAITIENQAIVMLRLCIFCQDGEVSGIRQPFLYSICIYWARYTISFTMKAVDVEIRQCNTLKAEVTPSI